ncbi:hypothetical protein BH11GEM2_BH11GEM2_10450 [soil metagenome]
MERRRRFLENVDNGDQVGALALEVRDAGLETLRVVSGRVRLR